MSGFGTVGRAECGGAPQVRLTEKCQKLTASSAPDPAHRSLDQYQFGVFPLNYTSSP